jgi:hypothetical protein
VLEGAQSEVDLQKTSCFLHSFDTLIFFHVLSTQLSCPYATKLTMESKFGRSYFGGWQHLNYDEFT